MVVREKMEILLLPLKKFNILKNADIETEIIQLAGETITGCIVKVPKKQIFT